MSNEESDFTNNVLMSARELLTNFTKQDFDTNIPFRGLAVRHVLTDIDFFIKLQVGALYGMHTEESINAAIHDFYVAWKNKTSRTT